MQVKQVPCAKLTSLSGFTGLNSEQKALLDFIVLSGGDSFVGFGSSTFSFYLQEYRTLRGVHKAKSVLVDSSMIGTDGLFSEAGRIS